MHSVQHLRRVIADSRTRKVDAVVIGGGICGLAANYELAAVQGMKTMLVDPTRAHTSFRGSANASRSYVDGPLRTMTDASRIRFVALSAMYQEISRHVLAGGDTKLHDYQGDLLVHGRNLNPEFLAFTKRLPSLWIARDQAEMQSIAAEMDRLPESFDWLERERVTEFCPVLDPHALVGAAVEKTDDLLANHAVLSAYYMGAAVSGNASFAPWEVHSITRLRDGWRVDFGRDGYPTGRVECGLIINAAGAWANRVAKMAGMPAPPMRTTQRTYFIADCESSAPVVGAGNLVIADDFYFRQEARGGDGVLRISPGDDVDWTVDSPWREQARADPAVVRRTMESVRGVVDADLRVRRDELGAQRSGGIRAWHGDGLPVVGMYPDIGYGEFTRVGSVGFQTGPANAMALGHLAADHGLPDRLAYLAEAVEAFAPTRAGFDDGTRPNVRGRVSIPVFGIKLGRVATGRLPRLTGTIGKPVGLGDRTKSDVTFRATGWPRLLQEPPHAPRDRRSR